MKTEIASEVGKHAFELAGLGLAPFRFVGMSENVICYPDGSQQAGGTCDYCSTGIRFECRVASADGKSFKVGCNCIAKVGDLGLMKAYKSSPEFRAHQRQLRHAKAVSVTAELKVICAQHEAEFKAQVHPYGFIDRKTGVAMTYWDYLEYSLWRSCGDAGRASWLKTLRKRFSAAQVAA